MIRTYFILFLLYIGLQIQSHAAIFEGYVKDFMGGGVKNQTIYFCDGVLVSQLLRNEQFLVMPNKSIIYKVLTNDEGLFRVETDSCRFANTFLVFNNDICFMYSMHNFNVLGDSVVYINTERFSTLEGQFGSKVDSKTVRHKKHRIVNEQGIEIETGMISRIIEKNGVATIKEGDWKQFYDSGELKMTGSYKKEKFNGSLVFYNKKGDVLLTIQYEEGEIVSYVQSVNGAVKNARVVGRFPHRTLIEL